MTTHDRHDTERDEAHMPEEIMLAKTTRPTKEQFLRSILAGAYIALGATLMLACKADGLPGLVCGMAFSLGLWLVMCAQGELFTGNCLMLSALGTEGTDNAKLARCLATTYLGNLIGSLVMVLLVTATGAYGDVDAAIATAKLAAPMHVTLAKSVLCNLCVCLAVHVGCKQTSPLEKLACALLPVACFVACGWEHSIADMFLLPLALPTVTDPVGIIRVILVATVGNMVAGYALAKVLARS